jgi:hypothetical protein
VTKNVNESATVKDHWNAHDNRHGNIKRRGKPGRGGKRFIATAQQYQTRSSGTKGEKPPLEHRSVGGSKN